MELIIENNLALTAGENEVLRKFSKFDSICYKTLKASMDATCKKLEKKIASILESYPYIGVMCDGSTASDSTHYICCFAVIPNRDLNPDDASDLPYHKLILMAFPS